MALPTRGPALAALSLILALGVTGCGGGDDKVTTKEPSATPTLTATIVPPSADPSVPGPITPVEGLPSDFPTDDVPLLGGAVKQPLGEGSGEEGKKGWVLELELAQKADDCFAAAATALIEHGFTKQPGELKEKDNHQAQFTAPGYAVIISTSTNESGGCRLGYEVGQIPIAPAQ